MSATLTVEEFPKPSSLLPHGPGFVLLDSIEAFCDDSITCKLCVEPNRVLGQNLPELPVWVGIEYMAQSAAALGALKAQQSDLAPQPGVVLGVKQLQSLVENFIPGQALLVSATLTYYQDPMRIFVCNIKNAQDQKLLMTGEISIFVLANVEQLQR